MLMLVCKEVELLTDEAELVNLAEEAVRAEVE